MTIFFSKNKFLIWLVFLVAPISAFSQTDVDFAEYLMNQRDYFRAITVYKRLLFDATENQLRYRYAQHIGEAYRLSGKYTSSIYFFTESLNYASTAEEQAKSLVGLGLDYYHMNIVSLAKNYFNQALAYDASGKTRLLLGLVEMEEGKWSSAAATFEGLAKSNSDAKLAETSKWLLGKAQAGTRLPKKSPALAAMMSSLLPGSGQIYCGHVFDGLQAMAFVGAFALATFQAYRYDRDVNDSDAILYLSASVSGFFYLANVMGAHQTAKFRNHQSKQRFIAEVRNMVFEVTVESHQKSFEEEEK